MRFLCIDLGDKRTGLAVGDDELYMAHPVCVLEISIGQPLVDAIVEAIGNNAADELVIGLPLHMDGTEGQRAKITKAFADQITNVVDITINFQDERLTSAVAEELLSGSGKTHKQKKQTRDALAAAEILTDFLSANRSSS